MKAVTAIQRMTHQRRILLAVMNRENWHPTAEEVYDEVRQSIPKISLGTMYRNLDVLSKDGRIVKMEQAGAQRRYDGNPSPHFHSVCLGCGEVNDVKQEEILWNGVQGITCPGFQVTGFQLIFEGYCERCRPSVKDMARE